MSTIAIDRPGSPISCSCHGFRRASHNFQLSSTSWTMTTKDSKSQKKNGLSIEKLAATGTDIVNPSSLQFNPQDHVFIHNNRFEFGPFAAREAILDEDYRKAAWLRAECHWEHRANDRYIDSYKRKFAEQEFIALKRRCNSLVGEKCTCIVTVKNEDKLVNRTVPESVVGTLDLSIQHLFAGEAFPGERIKMEASIFSSIGTKGPSRTRCGYIANLCVAKGARRQGIASNMLHFAIWSAKSNGGKQVFVHVHRNNRPAQELYGKWGFEVVEMASQHLAPEETYLLCCKT